MNPLTSEFEEASATAPAIAIPLSHMSVEIGHLYLDDIIAGPDRLVELAHQVEPWVRTARETCARLVAPKTARLSTCYLIDDYFSNPGSPQRVVPMMIAAARDAGLTIDYLARESSCAVAAGVPVAALVLDHLVADPPPGTNGTRPPPHDSGWLCNGVRSPSMPAIEAMARKIAWQPPVENGANRHSIFLDVQLWDEDASGNRRWSCPFLAAVWQLLRLGVLRTSGRPVVTADDWDGSLPETWRELPAILRLNPHAAPFAAYQTLSVLGNRFVPIEHAVRTILSQVAIETAVSDQIRERAYGERLRPPVEVVDRIGYAFVGEAWRLKD